MIRVLGKIRAVLMAAFLATLCAGCAQNVPTPAPVATEPMTIVMTKDLDITRVVNAKGALIPIHDDATANRAQLTERERPYLFGRAVMANPSNPSMTFRLIAFGRSRIRRHQLVGLPINQC